MRVNRRYVMAASTFVLAAASGQVMQQGALWSGPAASRSATAPAQLIDQTTEIVPLSAGPSVPGELPFIPSGPLATPLSLRTDTGLAARIGRLDTTLPTSGTAADREYTAFGFACDAPGLSVGRSADNALELVLAQPCGPSQAVSVVFGDLKIEAQTGDDGSLALALPDLGMSDRLLVTLSDGTELSAAVPAGSGQTSGAIALRWSGEASFGLGATGAGDRPPVEAASFRFGSGPDAETILLLPLDSDLRANGIEVAAEITPETCGRTVTARLMHLGDGRPVAEPLSFDLPDCSAVGDLVLLALPGEPLELARN